MTDARRQRPVLPHVPALDGLRGVAVAGILLFHAGHLRGGWLGVDLFFILSGYLITSLLCVEYAATGDIALRAFWARRARRLLPALFAMLAGVALYAAAWAEPVELAQIRADGLATLLYVANWNAIFSQQDYWAMFAAPSPFEHAWSLAIEEQFYAVWPVLALLLLRRFRGSPRALAVAATALALASFAAMATLYDDVLGTARVYFGTDTRASAVLLGSALAAWQRAHPAAAPAPAQRPIEAAGALAAAGLAGAWLQLDGQSAVVYRGGLFATQLAGVALLAAAALPGGRGVGRLLALPPLRALGLISYGLYLWHWPVYVWLDFQRTGLDGWHLTALRLATSIACSVVSYLALERPIRAGALSARSARAAAAGGAIALTALLVLATRPTPASDERAPWRVEPDAAGALNVLLLGDSVADSLVPLLREPARTRGLRIWSKTRGACTSMPNDVMRLAGGRVMIGDFCEAARAQWFVPERGFRPAVVLLVEGWAGIGERRIDGRWLHPCDPAYDARYARALQTVVERLAREIAPVAITAMPPVNARRASDAVLGGAGVDRHRLVSVASQRMQCQNAVRRAVARRTGARIIDLASQVCPGGRCPASDAAVAPRRDGLHFAGPAGLAVADWLAAELVDPGGATP